MALNSAEQYQNDPSETTLNGGIDGSTTAVVVTDGSVFPATTNGPFRIRIDNEYMKVTARSGNNLTVVRGDDGSTGAAHSNGAAVYHRLTEGGLIGVATNIIRTGSYSDRPAASVPQRIFIPTDDYGGVISLDDGSAWTNYGPVYAFTPPVSGDFAWQNQGDAVVTDHGWGFTLSKAGDGATDNWRSRVKSTPGTPWTLTVFMKIFAFNKANLRAGLVLRESGTGELHFFGWDGGNNVVATDNLAGDTSALSLAGNELAQIRTPPEWWRITDNGTNLIFQWSLEGKVWYTQNSFGRTTHMAGGPDQFGVTVNARNNATPNYDMSLTLFHWDVS